MPHHSILSPGFALLLASVIGLPACSGENDDASDGGSSSSGYCQSQTPALVNGSGVPKNPATPLSETPVAGSTCNAVEREFPLEPGVHTQTFCVEVDYTTNPPCTGPHYGSWADFLVYDEPIPRGFWVHSLEHGAVAMLYSCTDCDAEVAAAKALRDDIGVDPYCVANPPLTTKIVLTPDPRLETTWAAASWGFTLTADCFEPEVFRTFVLTHRGNAVEPFCNFGIDVSKPP